MTLSNDFMITDLCPTCGEVMFPGRLARLNMYSDGTHRITYQCPSCKLRILKPLEHKHYLVLYPRLTKVFCNPPDEMTDGVRLSGARLDDREVADFIECLTIYPFDRILEEAEAE